MVIFSRTAAKRGAILHPSGERGCRERESPVAFSGPHLIDGRNQEWKHRAEQALPMKEALQHFKADGGAKVGLTGQMKQQIK
jgi:hypothetical protein